MDRVTELVAKALGLGRLARQALHDVIVPALPPRRRAMTERLAIRLGQDHHYDEDLLAQLEGVNSIVQQMIEMGTYRGWVGGDEATNGVYRVVHQSDEALALSAALHTLRAHSDAVAASLDAARAYTVANVLLGE